MKRIISSCTCYFFCFVCLVPLTGCNRAVKGFKNSKDAILCDYEEVIYTYKDITNKAIIKKCTDSDSSSFVRGKNFALVERWDEAMVEFKKDLSESKDEPYCHFNLGVAYEAKGNFRMALKEYDKAFNLNPEEPLFQQAWKRADDTMKGLSGSD